jgi:hypothetical protein
MKKDKQLNLFEKLSDEIYKKKLSESSDKKLSSKEFWKEDEKRYLELVRKLNEEHKSIEMSYEKFNKPFTISTTTT